MSAREVRLIASYVPFEVLCAFVCVRVCVCVCVCVASKYLRRVVTDAEGEHAGGGGVLAHGVDALLSVAHLAVCVETSATSDIDNDTDTHHHTQTHTRIRTGHDEQLAGDAGLRRRAQHLHQGLDDVGAAQVRLHRVNVRHRRGQRRV